MTKYERQPVEIRALHEGDLFEQPGRPNTICRVDYRNLVTEEGKRVLVVGYDIIDGPLHWPVIHCAPDFLVMLLLPKTTSVSMSGTQWVEKMKSEAEAS